MIKPIHGTKSYHADHSTYGGKIYYSDFHTGYKRKNNAQGSAIAARIIQDQKFDEQCRNRRIMDIQMQSER